jgi:threonine/homoserine/homoserine lactone efflux protein
MSAASANVNSVGQGPATCQVGDCYDRAVGPNVWAFTAMTVPFVASFGPSTAVVLRNSVAGGVRAGIATAVGVNAGTICYGVVAALGVSALLQRWPGVWLALRFAGIAYLAWLGGRSLIRACTRERRAASTAVDAARAPLSRSAREGFLTNALNPSIATFYLLVVPQFIPIGAPFVASALVLTAIHVSLAITWHLTWATAGGTLADLLARERPRRILEAATGLALLGFAVKLLP